MRIAMLAPRPSVRGPLPKLTPLLADALRRRGWEVDVLPWGRREDAEGLASKFGTRARDVALARKRIVGGDFSAVLVNTAHDWRTLARDLSLFYALPRKTVVVPFFHGSQSGRLVGEGSWPFKKASAALVARADGILVLSSQERDQWQTFRPVQAHVVRYPRPQVADPAADPAAKPARDGREHTILCVARLMRPKGVLDLVRALPIVHETMPSCRLVLAGQGPAEGEIRELAAALGVESAVTLTGYVEGGDLEALYRVADVFALPTTHDEGFPYVVLEAMANGLPIVTTAWRGPADELREGTHALFVPPESPPALAAALVRVLSDAELRRSMGAANRDKIREFDADRVVEDYVSALEAIAGKARTVA